MNSKLRIVGEEQPKASSGIERGAFQGRAAIITLGCAKNQVDSEVMFGALQKAGFDLVDSVEDADVAIVNTCGFLQSAVQESIDCIVDVASLKEAGRLRKLIVAGCLVERYRGELKEELPEVDSFIGTDDLLVVADVASGMGQAALEDAARPYFLYDDSMPRHLSTSKHFAYVKIAEGCDRPCTFCIIPRIRGIMRSRDIESIRREVIDLGEQGVREVNLVAQDLTSFGKDRKSGGLLELIQKLDKDSAVDWIRLLYSYPVGIDEDLLRAIVELPTLCNYLDLPLQHSSSHVLKNMKRPIGRYGARKMTEFIRQTAPELALRTTFIVGFPGETEEDVADLEAFVSEGHFSSVGVFCYSPEDGTPAGAMENQVSEEEREERRGRVMLAQQEVNQKRSEELIGETVEVLIDGAHEDTDLLWSARSQSQAPEVDGVVIINDMDERLNNELRAGLMARVEITELAGYDLVGRVTEIEEV